MVPTEFITVSLPALGTTGGVQVANRAPYDRRVLIVQTSAFADPVFVSSIASELSMVGSAVPGGAMALPLAAAGVGIPLVLALPAGQPLFAAAVTAGTRVTVSISGEIPVTREVHDLHETTFRSYTPPVIGGGAPVIVPSGSVPRRVIVRAAGGGVVFVAPNASELNNPGVAFPGYELQVGLPHVFVLAPQQPLYAVQPVGAAVTSVFVTASDIQTGSPQGLTGIPGPGSQE